MENKNPNNPGGNSIAKTATLRTLKNDIARATEKKSEKANEPLPPLPPPLPQKEIEELKPSAPPKEVTESAFVRSEILDLKDREAPPLPKKESFGVSPIRTYTGDVAEEVKSGNTSLIKIAVAEEEKRIKEKNIEDTERKIKRSNLYMILGSICFISLGVAIFYYFTYIPKIPSPLNEHIAKSDFIVSEQKKEIFLGEDRQSFINNLFDELSVSIPQSTIQKIEIKEEITKNEISSAEFLAIVAPNIPPTLIRSLDQKFVLGVHGNLSPKPFLLLKINSYENAFAGMLRWEAEIRNDLGKFFLKSEDREPLYSASSSTIALKKPLFLDRVIKNRDIRFLENDSGEMVLMYTFISKDFIIITTNTETLDEVAERIRRAQIIR